jgi:hypothetical protein
MGYLPEDKSNCSESGVTSLNGLLRRRPKGGDESEVADPKPLHLTSVRR